MDGPVGMLRPDEAAMFEGQPKGFPFLDFHIEDVMLPEGDDMGIPSEDDDLDDEGIEQETGFENVIVVDNLPVIPPEKVDKLSTVLRKIYTSEKIGGDIREGGFVMPMDEAAGTTKGFAFIEYLDQATARRAVEATNGYALDKKHTFNVCMFTEFDKYARVPDEYATPELPKFEPVEGLLDWMMDKRGRDQFLLRWGDETEIFWNDAQRGVAEDVYKRSMWTESFVQWSPQGNMLATIHTKGVALWGGPGFKRLQRIAHPGVRLIEFSPCERYLVSYSAQEPNNPRDVATVQLVLFDIRSGKKLRVFEGKADEYAVGSAAGPGGALKWPVFKWAGGNEDKYFARLGKGFISVFDTPDATLLDKKSLKLEGVQDFAWSPAEPILSVYQTEQGGGNQPARISLIRIPDRVELRQKNLFSVSDVQMFWHPQGTYLAVKVDRFTKTKKSTYTSFELFRLRERDIPMEVLELPNKADKVVDFAWEPKGHRFAVLHGEGSRPNVSFYSMRDAKTGAKGVVTHLGTLANRPCNSLCWSPTGKNILLAGLKSLNGQLEFFNVDEFETMNTGEHFMATDAEWDPTGRYISTYVTSLHQVMENGYQIWTFNGQLLYRTPKDRMLQFCWRPRHASLLNAEQEKEVLKNLKKYSKKYDEEDANIGFEEDAKLREERERLLQAWQEWVESKQQWVEQMEEGKRQLLGSRYRDDEYTVEEVQVTSTIEQKEEPYKSGN